MDMKKTEIATNQTQNCFKKTQKNFNGAIFINKDGKEIPITEAMIQNACKNLHDTWFSSNLRND